MHIFTRSAILLAATAMLAPAAANARTLAQPQTNSAAPAIKVDPANWLYIETENGSNYVHKSSGAICIEKFRDLKLATIRDYAPDGTNSACQYDKTTEAGLSRLTIYVYTAPGLTGPAAYQGAKDAITQFNQNTAVTVTQRKEEGQNCHKGVIQPLAEGILSRMKKEGSEGEDANLGLGIAMYDYDIPVVNGRPARQETSLLSVYQTGKWIVKTRVTLPKSETSYADACNYGGIASVGQARVITRQDAPAITDS
ncbi:MAG: hypothetical protein ABJX46_02080 [Erythrobacter sp.]